MPRVMAVTVVGENMTVKVHYQQPAEGLFVAWKLRNGIDYFEKMQPQFTINFHTTLLQWMCRKT